MTTEIEIENKSNVINIIIGFLCQYITCGIYRKNKKVWKRNILKLCLPQNAKDLDIYGCNLIFLYIKTIRIVMTVSNTNAYGTINLAGIESIVNDTRPTLSHEVSLPCIVLTHKFLAPDNRFVEMAATGGVTSYQSGHCENSIRE